MEILIGEWKFVTSDNMDAVLEKLGVNFLLRKMAKTMKPDLKIEYNKNDNKWTTTLISTFKTIISSFELDKEFEEDTPDGRKVRSLVFVDGDKLIKTQRDKKGMIVKNIWELNTKGQLISITSIDDVSGYRIFERK